ncbi:MAG: reverse gyrase [Desulfurococcaceae archaeon]
MASHVNELRVRGIYRHACPNCGGPISDLRLLLKAPCEVCLPEEDLAKVLEITSKDIDMARRLKMFYALTRREGDLKKIIDEELEFIRFEKFFETATGGYKMWSSQKTWARRVLRGFSFSIIAPTGTGKTVFSLIMALYIVTKFKNRGVSKVYLVFPTLPLLLQAERKLVQFANNLSLKLCSDEEWGNNCIKVLHASGKLNKEEKERVLERLKAGDFDIFMSTSAFIHRNIDIIPKGIYKLIVMDDVDAVLKSGRAVRRLLNIIGLNDEIIDKGLELIKHRARLAFVTENREQVEQQIRKLEEEIERAKASIKTILLVNSATGRPRGIYPKLFKIFLNFEAGAKPEAIRNIVDTYTIPTTTMENRLVELVSKLRDGILIFVPVDKGIEYAEDIASLLRKNGFNAEAYHARKDVDVINRFAKGEINVLIGVATYYGVMVRGIDLPERVKYVIFTGVPRHKFSSRLENVSPQDILRLLVLIRDITEGEEKSVVEKLIGRLSRRLKRISQGVLLKLREEFINALAGSPSQSAIVKDLLDAYKILKRKLEMPDTWSKLEKLGDIGLVREGNEYYLLIPDVATYIQASGRASRLYPGGITKGLSIIIVDDVRLLNGLVKRMRWIFEDFSIRELSEIDLDGLKRTIEDERKLVTEIINGKIKPDKQVELVKTALLIVESPNKAKTIANFFGKPSTRVLGNGLQSYEVSIGNYVLSIIASAGHVYDLVTDDKPIEAEKYEHLYGVLKTEQGFIPIYTDIKKCLNGHQFTEEILDRFKCPKCPPDQMIMVQRKLDVIKTLRDLAREVDLVLIGTDPDAEGEKIAWDLRVMLEPYAREIKRIEFHEVTRRALLAALVNPRDFDTRLVEAQIVRRVEDRWLGFSLSHKVQKYAWLRYCLEYLTSKSVEKRACCSINRNLSAGRVQTPVLEFIINEYEKGKKPEYMKYAVFMEINGKKVSMILSYDEAVKIGLVDISGKKVKDMPPVEAEIVEEYKEEISPPPPFTTDTMLEEASRTLGLTTTRAMEIAQDLFEMGFITYHRTDSTRVSDVGINIAKQYLDEKYGEESKNMFKPRVWGTGGAHEAIRPTRPIDADRLVELLKEGVIMVPIRITRDHVRLYDLIFRRFVASQMRNAVVEKQRIKIKINGFERIIEIPVEIVERGYIEMYNNIGTVFQRLGNKGDKLYGYVSSISKLKPPLPRFHDVIKWMKENGIGRPSTYAKIVQTLLDRRYVDVSKKAKALIPQARGKYILDFLKTYYGDVVSVETTRKLEKIMQEIEEGKANYQDVLNALFNEVKERVIDNTHVNTELEKFYVDTCGAY